MVCFVIFIVFHITLSGTNDLEKFTYELEAVKLITKLAKFPSLSDSEARSSRRFYEILVFPHMHAKTCKKVTRKSNKSVEI